MLVCFITKLYRNALLFFKKVVALKIHVKNYSNNDAYKVTIELNPDNYSLEKNIYFISKIVSDFYTQISNNNKNYKFFF